MKRVIITENFYKKISSGNRSVLSLLLRVPFVLCILELFSPNFGAGFIRCEDNTASRGSGFSWTFPISV